jgi:hypothetical protein
MSVAFERAKQRESKNVEEGKPVCETSGSSPPRCCPLNVQEGRENIISLNRQSF